MSKWMASDTPGEIHVMLDGVDKSLLYRTIRECRQVVENLMNVLYPGWAWGKTTKFFSKHDNQKKVRLPEDVTTEQCLSIFFTHDHFTTPFWKMVSGRTGNVQVLEADIAPFLKVR